MTYKRAISQGLAAIVVIGLVIVVGFGVYLNDTLNTTPTSKTISSSRSPNETSTISSANTYASGEKLQINLNATQIVYGGHLAVNVQLYNPLSTSIALMVNYSQDGTILSWDSQNFVCGANALNNPVDGLFAYAVYQGHFTQQNYSSSSPLVLAPTVAYLTCATYNQPNISEITLASASNLANLSDGNSMAMQMNATTQQCESNAAFSISCGQGSSLYGYWTEPTGNESCSPQSTEAGVTDTAGLYCHLVTFPVGEYTVVAQDLWNQTVYAYFQVTPQ